MIIVVSYCCFVVRRLMFRPPFLEVRASWFLCSQLADEEEDDDLAILELRRKCLESLASVTDDGLSGQRGSVTQKCRQRLQSFRRNKSKMPKLFYFYFLLALCNIFPQIIHCKYWLLDLLMICVLIDWLLWNLHVCGHCIIFWASELTLCFMPGWASVA